MEILFFVVVYGFSILLSVSALRYLYGTRFLLTPLHIYLGLYLIVVWPGGVLVFLDHGASEYGYLFLLFSGWFLPLLSALAMGVNFRSLRVPQGYTRCLSFRALLMLTVFGVVISIATLVYMRQTFSNAPLFLILAGDDVSGSLIAKTREEVIQGGGKLFALVSLVPKVFLLLISARLLHEWMLQRRKVALFGLVVLIVSGVFLNMLSGAKAIALYYLFTIAFYYLLVRARGLSQKEKTYMVIAFVAANGYLWFWYYLMFGDLFTVFQAWSHRFFITYPTLIYEAYHTFGEAIDFLMGRTFPNPKHILPFDNVNFAMLMGDLHIALGDHSTAEKLGLHTVANTAAIAEWYANFGILGAVVFGLALGFMLHYFYLWYNSSRKSWLESIVYSIFSLKLALLAVQYTGSLLDYASIVTVLFYFVAKFSTARGFNSQVQLR